MTTILGYQASPTWNEIEYMRHPRGIFTNVPLRFDAEREELENQVTRLFSELKKHYKKKFFNHMYFGAENHALSFILLYKNSVEVIRTAEEYGLLPEEMDEVISDSLYDSVMKRPPLASLVILHNDLIDTTGKMNQWVNSGSAQLRVPQPFENENYIVLCKGDFTAETEWTGSKRYPYTDTGYKHFCRQRPAYSVINSLNESPPDDIDESFFAWIDKKRNPIVFIVKKPKNNVVPQIFCYNRYSIESPAQVFYSYRVITGGSFILYSEVHENMVPII